MAMNGDFALEDRYSSLKAYFNLADGSDQLHFRRRFTG
jgi:hypothetical protein